MKNSRILKTTLIALTLCLQFSIGHAQVGINQPTPDSSAILDLKSDNKGLLIPRLTSSEIQLIPNPAEGLLCYCTDLSIFCYFNGTDWMALPAWGWKLNLGDPSANGQKISAHIYPDTKVGIGSNTPQSKLTVVGNLAVGADVVAQADGAYIKGQVKIGNAPDAGDTEKLEVDGNINASGRIRTYGYDLLPKGAIIMWSGNTDKIYLKSIGWGLCDGTEYAAADGTANVVSPDLRGRFIVGYGTRPERTLNQDGSYTNGPNITYSIGASTIGVDKVKITEAQMPLHNHDNNTLNDQKTATDTHKHTWNFVGNTRDIFDNDGSGSEDNCITLGDKAAADFLQTEIDNINTNMNKYMVNNIHNHTIYPRGNNLAHENRPPYYVLAYIIKL
ncbi:MAG: hypothetical protein A2W99_14335 [Bacteroidetes bacterium GWF2_33_16]|nr:MAG: hypothetical protein A2X00_06265 [Bacteroidetes bacterium GWE2_32_14]OFY04803.1 MAG: hypothetical protein A2W99_14335 [Bacteroidetes bacterium GWF2_33_16]